MRAVRTASALRELLASPRRRGAKIGLVPTMGALHDGHLALIRRARRECDVVVVSLFVNPSQFDDPGDLQRYPRSERRDAELAAQAGADVLFAPPVEEVYPPGFATRVEVLGLTDSLEGASRGVQHFRGVTTVVARLLCMTLPDAAYFGQKDAQQAVVIGRMVRDLGLPVRIEVVPTVRDADGLALSSRNALLSPAQRERALALPRALAVAERLVREGERSGSALAVAARAELERHDVQVDYAAVVDPQTLEPLEEVSRRALLALAARVDEVRLIDNVLLPAPDEPASADKETPDPEGDVVKTCSA